MQDTLLAIGGCGIVVLLVALLARSVWLTHRRHDPERASIKAPVVPGADFVLPIATEDAPVAVFFRFDVGKESSAEDAYGLALELELVRSGQVVQRMAWLSGEHAHPSEGMESRKVAAHHAFTETNHGFKASFELIEVPPRSAVELRGRVRTFPGTSLAWGWVYIPSTR
ncbi:hypothetical protein WMF04_40555 [Sorangium sp. So ce260]|uniref:hypothetical protein n=1 Tax=Sorangium sp. So ce260 TaxID=3133291 RepID=UPI003F5E2858